MAARRADVNRKFRQDNFRELLANQKHAEHVSKILDELMDDGVKLDSLGLQRKKLVIDTKLALMKKYIPDLKSVEITGADGGDIETSNKFTIEVVGAASADTGEITAATETEKV
jgi:uncharacterized HAD superfamily protein